MTYNVFGGTLNLAQPVPVSLSTASSQTRDKETTYPEACILLCLRRHCFSADTVSLMFLQ